MTTTEYRVTDHAWSYDAATGSTCCEYTAGAHNPATRPEAVEILARRAAETARDDARMNFVDELAELFAGLIQAGVTEDEVRADFEAQMSLQMWTDEPEGPPCPACQSRGDCAPDCAYAAYLVSLEHDCPRGAFLGDPITQAYGVGSEMVSLIACPVCDAR